MRQRFEAARPDPSLPRRKTPFVVVGVAAMAVGCLALAAQAQQPPASMPGPIASGIAEPSPPSTDSNIAPVDDPALALQKKRDEVRKELQDLSRTIALSTDKSRELEQAIAALEKSSASLRQALIDSAARRKELEVKISQSERKLASFRMREDEIRASFKDRRALLAEVLAALQRMGRNPPPALLVTPEDALGSVRTAILLGAVVPGIRKETQKLADDLQELVTVRTGIETEKKNFVSVIADQQEEERRMDLLLVENDRLSRTSATALDAEKRRSEELAGKATSLEGLIGSLETEIESVRDAMRKAREEEQRQRQVAEEQRRKAQEEGLPDKNRIAPAYLFSDLKDKLELPAAGEILRRFGDPDGTGHTAKGVVVASAPGSIVTAPADGWVMFAGEFRSYGQMVILNAGDGYHLVMSGMDRVTTRQGSFVLAGEPVGTMGEKRVASATALALETDRPTLYIEFRKDGVPVDSRPWWAAKDTGKAGNDS